MNILFVHEVDWIRKPVIDTHWLAESMSLLGHNVYALYYESLWGLNGWRAPKRAIVSRVFDDAKVELICPKFIRLPVISRASAFATHYFGIKQAIQENNIDAIVLYSVPTNGLQTMHWARHFGVPVVFRSLDILNQLVAYPILQPLTKYMEKKVYSGVDRILAITPKLCDYAVSLGADPDKAEVLPVPVDTNLFKLSDQGIGEVRRKWGLSNDDKVIVFMGTLFNFSGLDEFLPEFARKDIDAKVLIVGDGEQRGKLEQIVRVYNLHNKVIITGFQPYKDLPKYLNMAAVCINPFIINDTTRDIFPGKTAQILACGKPLVMRPLDGVKAMISGDRQGVVYADDIGGVVNAVASLLDDGERREKIGQNGLRYAKSYHGHLKVATRLERILDELA